MKISELYQYFLKFPKISTDSRNIAKGSIFFALKGENFNGNKYAKQAIENGASIAVIDEDTCIGCTLCIQACPVDAILGSAKHMHTIIEKECTGCELCLPPCPVDCIDMIVIQENTENWKWKYPVFNIKNQKQRVSH